jgi:hypothetical protein
VWIKRRLLSTARRRIGGYYWNLGASGGWKLDRRSDKMVLYMNYDAKLYKLSTIHAGEAGLMLKW